MVVSMMGRTDIRYRRGTVPVRRQKASKFPEPMLSDSIDYPQLEATPHAAEKPRFYPQANHSQTGTSAASLESPRPGAQGNAAAKEIRTIVATAHLPSTRNRTCIRNVAHSGAVLVGCGKAVRGDDLRPLFGHVTTALRRWRGNLTFLGLLCPVVMRPRSDGAACPLK